FWLARAASPEQTPTAGAAAMLAELQDSREPWEANRGDLSRLMSDLRSDAIASAALGADAIYISTTDAQRYWVPDQSGRVATLLLEQYAGGKALFPLAMFQTDADKPLYQR